MGASLKAAFILWTAPRCCWSFLPNTILIVPAERTANARWKLCNHVCKKALFRRINGVNKEVKSSERKYWVARSIGCAFIVAENWSVPKRQTPAAIEVVTPSSVPFLATTNRNEYMPNPSRSEWACLPQGGRVSSRRLRL